jgi:hypothetical protein
MLKQREAEWAQQLEKERTEKEAFRKELDALKAKQQTQPHGNPSQPSGLGKQMNVMPQTFWKSTSDADTPTSNKEPPTKKKKFD